jgi:hypothetical protein
MGMIPWFHAVFWTIHAQEKPNTGKRGAQHDLILKLKQSSTEEMETKQ